MNSHFPAIIITVIALLGVIGRMIWPDLKIDSITIGLLFIALIPWLPKYLKSAKLPGGWEVNFNDLQNASKKIIESDGQETENEIEYDTVSYLSVADDDPSLGLVGLRIEIEKRIRDLASKSRIDDHGSLKMVISTLHSAGVLDSDSFSGLNQIVKAANNAAHGALVDKQVANWAINQGPKVLATLDSKIFKAQGRSSVTGY